MSEELQNRVVTTALKNEATDKEKVLVYANYLAQVKHRLVKGEQGGQALQKDFMNAVRRAIGVAPSAIIEPSTADIDAYLRDVTADRVPTKGFKTLNAVLMDATKFTTAICVILSIAGVRVDPLVSVEFIGGLLDISERSSEAGAIEYYVQFRAGLKAQTAAIQSSMKLPRLQAILHALRNLDPCLSAKIIAGFSTPTPGAGPQTQGVKKNFGSNPKSYSVSTAKRERIPAEELCKYKYSSKCHRQNCSFRHIDDHNHKKSRV
jgi:hypothetical protein